MTFDRDQPADTPATIGDLGARERHDVYRILSKSDLPSSLKRAPISKIIERTVDEEEVERLTDPSRIGEGVRNKQAVLDKRRVLLTRYEGRELICVLILLPGVRYTIEIDPVTEKVVHWECEAT